MTGNSVIHELVTRRRLLGAVALGGLSLFANSARARTIQLPLPGGPDARELASAFPQKGTMILSEPARMHRTGVGRAISPRHYKSKCD